MFEVIYLWYPKSTEALKGYRAFVENRNLLSHPDDLRMEVYVMRTT